MLDHFKQRNTKAIQQITFQIEVEQSPFTCNTHYLLDYKEKFLAHYKQMRFVATNKKLSKELDEYKRPFLPGFKVELSGIGKIMEGLAEIGMHDVKARDLAKLLPSDGMEPMLAIMADVRAYFQGV